jgi:RNA polymerase sigma-70 factor (ECF subfamily)
MTAEIPPSSDERDLLLRHREGDADAFGALVQAYRQPVYSYLIRCGVAESDRDDLFQDIFIRVHRAAASYEPDRPLHPWLFTIVANSVRNWHRRSKVRAMVFAASAEADPSTESADGERHAIARQTAAHLEQAIGGLTLPQREVLVLACIENLPQKEIASALGMPVNTVKTHLRRARLALMRELDRFRPLPNGEVPS